VTADAFARAVNLHQAGRLDEAAALYEAVIADAPARIDALYNLGLIRRARGRADDALALWRTAVAQAPGLSHVHTAMGKTHASLDQFEAALACYDRALAAAPDNVDALNCRGNALRVLGRLGEAVEAYDQTLAIQPDYAVAWSNRGHALAGLRRPGDAVASYRRALALNPEDAPILGAQLDQQLQVCDWTDYISLTARIAELVGQGRNADLPFSFLSHSTDPMDQLRCAQVRVRERFPQPFPALWSGKPYAHDKIRLAYVSSDFREHAVAHLIAGLFERHDRARFDVSGYALAPQADDDMRRRIAAGFDHFHDVAGLHEAQVAAMIRAAEIDIAIDLNGFTTYCRPGIFARRCAPIQVNYLGYPGAVGAELADYILGDAEVIPPGAEAAYGEQVIRLPQAYQINDSRRRIAEGVPSRAEAGLPTEGFVFCCFNANYKINPPVFDAWMRLLGKVEGSVLWLFESNPMAAGNLRTEAERRGVSGDRIVFAPRMAAPEHLARHRLADLFLDTGPYNAHTTASDALWAGLPLVTCRGATFASRVAASLLRAVGLPELITDSLADYEALALELANDPVRLAAMRDRLEADRDTAPLFDTDLSRRHIEVAYETAMDRLRQGLPPVGFDVPA
jgi:protein O-GlcNAc transferase